MHLSPSQFYRSVGFGSFMTATEKVVYQASSENPEHTVAVKSAWVESSFYGLRTAIKNFGIERFKKNCVKATEGFNYVLEKFSRQQASLRELGTVKLAEFQVWVPLCLIYLSHHTLGQKRFVERGYDRKGGIY